MYGNLVLDEYPLIVLPKLATAIGLNDAIILQQIHYWINKYRNHSDPKEREQHFRDGRVWIYNSVADWKENFPFWSEHTIRRTLTRLRGAYENADNGDDQKVTRAPLVLIARYNKKGYDRTLWYSIDYDELKRIAGVVQDDVAKMDTSTGQNGQMDVAKMDAPIPETTQETTTSPPAEDTPPNGNSSEEEFTALFGEQPEYNPPPQQHWSEKITSEPWNGWSEDHFRERDGVSVSAQERIGALLEKHTGERPRSDGQWLGWGNTVIEMYNAADGNWRAIEQGIKDAAGRDPEFVPHIASRKGDINGWVNAVARAVATPPQIDEHERFRQRMEGDPQVLTFRALRREREQAGN